jgi:uncharacterized membrane protein YccC
VQEFISWHVFSGFLLLILASLAGRKPTIELSRIQRIIVYLFFIGVWVLGAGGIAIGIYRHPTSISVFQVVTCIGLVFSTIGVLALVGRPAKFKSQTWFINGLGGSLIATVSASLFFMALQFFPDFYKDNIVWFTILFIGVPVMLGREYIKRFSRA